MTISRPSAAAILDAFGGVGPLADAIGAPYSTVHTWKRLDAVPRWRMTDIEKAARKRRIKLPSAEADARAA
jgi:fermentation-respiration switch protein FrsA (DUF1100 family)